MNRPIRTGDDAFAAAMGVAPSTAATTRKRIIQQDPDAAEGFATIDAKARAQAAVADLEAVRSINEEDIADLAAEPDPVAALREEVRDRADRRLQAQIAAHTSWAETGNPTERTRPAREAFLASFERKVDPEGKLPQSERARRAQHAHKAHMLSMALKSAAARRAKRAAGERQEQVPQAHSRVPK
jgi:hypothetical protein